MWIVVGVEGGMWGLMHAQTTELRADRFLLYGMAQFVAAVLNAGTQPVNRRKLV